MDFSGLLTWSIMKKKFLLKSFLYLHKKQFFKWKNVLFLFEITNHPEKMFLLLIPPIFTFVWKKWSPGPSIKFLVPTRIKQFFTPKEKISYTFPRKFLAFVWKNQIFQRKIIPYNYWKKQFFKQIIYIIVWKTILKCFILDVFRVWLCNFLF